MKRFLGLLLSAVILVSLFWIRPVSAYAAPSPQRLYVEEIEPGSVYVFSDGSDYYFQSRDGNTVYFSDYMDHDTGIYTIDFIGTGDVSITETALGKPDGGVKAVASEIKKLIIVSNYFYCTPVPDPAPCASSSPSHVHEWTEGIIYDATNTTDGLEGIYCKTCGAIKESSPISAYSYSLNDYATPMINAAKAGQTITFEFGEWNSFPKAFMEKLVSKSAQNVTFVFHYKWNHVKQEITIPAGTPIDLNFDYYGPAKMAELYGMY